MMIFFVILALVVVYGVIVYNGWITGKEAVINNYKTIGVQLDARGKVIDSLVSISNKYTKHEERIFIQLAEFRAQAQGAKTPAERQVAEKGIDSIIKSGGLNVVVENYPQLGSDQLFIKNQEAIQSEEQKLAYAKKAYNYSIEDLKISLEKFPNNLFAGALGGKALSVLREYPYWDISQEERRTEEEKRMNFDN